MYAAWRVLLQKINLTNYSFQSYFEIHPCRAHVYARNPASVERPSRSISLRLRVSSLSRGAGAFYTGFKLKPVEEATGASWISSTPVKTVQTSATHQQNNGRLPCGIRVLRWLRSPGRGSLSFLPFSPPSAFTHRASSGGSRRAQQTLLPVWCQGSPGTTVRAEGSQKSLRSPPGCRKTPQRPDSLLSIRVGAFA